MTRGGVQTPYGCIVTISANLINNFPLPQFFFKEEERKAIVRISVDKIFW
jgi:hypothetical protein